MVSKDKIQPGKRYRYQCGSLEDFCTAVREYDEDVIAGGDRWWFKFEKDGDIELHSQLQYIFEIEEDASTVSCTRLQAIEKITKGDIEGAILDLLTLLK